MQIWDIDDGVDKKSIIAWCSRDREKLAADFFLKSPEYEGKPSALWLEIFLDLCGIKVRDCPLALGQLGLCDIEQKIIFINSKMGDFVHHKTNLEALRASTLAHEFGHIRLHAGEDYDHIFVSSYRQDNKMLHHPRAYQREREADLYAALFLVPLEDLKTHKAAQTLNSYRQDGRTLTNATIWKSIYGLARDFHVSPTLMRRSLLEIGWIERVNGKRGYQEVLKLRLRN